MNRTAQLNAAAFALKASGARVIDRPAPDTPAAEPCALCGGEGHVSLWQADLEDTRTVRCPDCDGTEVLIVQLTHVIEREATAGAVLDGRAIATAAMHLRQLATGAADLPAVRKFLRSRTTKSAK